LVATYQDRNVGLELQTFMETRQGEARSSEAATSKEDGKSEW
jgi:hypothetical protein